MKQKGSGYLVSTRNVHSRSIQPGDIIVTVDSVSTFKDKMKQPNLITAFVKLQTLINEQADKKFYNGEPLPANIKLENYIGKYVYIASARGVGALYYISGESHYKMMAPLNAASAQGGNKLRKSRKSHKSRKLRKSRKSRKLRKSRKSRK